MVSLKKSHLRSWPSPGSQSTVLFPWAVTEVKRVSLLQVVVLQKLGRMKERQAKM